VDSEKRNGNLKSVVAAVFALFDLAPLAEEADLVFLLDRECVVIVITVI